MKSETKPQPNEAATTTAEPNEMLGDDHINRIIEDANSRTITGPETIENLVKAGRSLRMQGQDNRLKRGEVFHLLRHECEPYEKSPKSGLTYNQSLARMGEPRGTSEHLRKMFEVKVEYAVPADTFLLLSADGMNLADLKVEYGEAFKAFIDPWLPKIQALYITDEKAVASLIEDIEAAKPKGMTPKTLAQLDAELSELKASLDAAMEKKNSNEVLDISSHITAKEEEKGKICVTRMESLLDVVAPFFGWSQDQVKKRMKAFEAEPAPLRIQRYKEALNFIKKMETAFAINTKAAAA